MLILSSGIIKLHIFFHTDGDKQNPYIRFFVVPVLHFMPKYVERSCQEFDILILLMLFVCL